MRQGTWVTVRLACVLRLVQDAIGRQCLISCTSYLPAAAVPAWGGRAGRQGGCLAAAAVAAAGAAWAGRLVACPLLAAASLAGTSRLHPSAGRRCQVGWC